VNKYSVPIKRCNPWKKLTLEKLLKVVAIVYTMNHTQYSHCNVSVNMAATEDCNKLKLKEMFCQWVASLFEHIVLKL